MYNFCTIENCTFGVLKQKEDTPQTEKYPLATQELKSGEKGADTRKSPFGLGFVPAEWALTT